MSLDLSLLQLLKHKGDFYRIKGRIPDKAMDSQTTLLLEYYEKYFDTFPEAKVIDPQKLITVFRAGNPDMGQEIRLAYETIISNIGVNISEDDKAGLMFNLLELRLGTDLANLVDKWDGGDIKNIHATMRELGDEFEKDADIKGLDFIRPDLAKLLEESKDTAGYQWRLQCLRDTMRGLKGGDFGILAARPDAGKTTFLASEATYIAPQLEHGRTILWLNNEGNGERIYLRLVQAALGCAVSEIRAMADPMGEYLKAIGGTDKYKIRIVDIHGQDTYAVENLIRANNPGLIVFDMIDRIKGFGSEARTDLALEEMYAWARDKCVQYDCVGIGTSQISNEGDNLTFPSMGMLKDSKTGKQGACDFQIMIGKLNDQAYEGVRYIGTPKNKLRREGGKSTPNATVNFRPQIARFEDLPIEAAA